MGDNETSADILREMRDGIHTGRADIIDFVNGRLRDYADRIEAAEELDRELAQKTLEGAQCTPPPVQETAKIEQPGNAADQANRFAHCTRFPGTGCMLHEKNLYNCSECRWEQMPYEGNWKPMEANNNAALREALETARRNIQIARRYIAGQSIENASLMAAVEAIDAAFSAPARNCDVGTADEQADRFKAFCHANRTPYNECSKECPFNDTSAVCYCQARWAQMLYAKAEGGDHA